MLGPCLFREREKGGDREKIKGIIWIKVLLYLNYAISNYGGKRSHQILSRLRAIVISAAPIASSNKRPSHMSTQQ